MSPEQEQFLNDCPAWARRAGITNLLQWQICLSLASLPWPDRHDKLDEMKAVVVETLRVWDDMGERHDN